MSENAVYSEGRLVSGLPALNGAYNNRRILTKMILRLTDMSISVIMH